MAGIIDERQNIDEFTGRETVTTTALVSNSPAVEALAKIPSDLFGSDPLIREQRLGIYLKRTFGAEGLRHLYGFLIALEEHGRRGYFKFNVNDHLKRLGYKKKSSGGYRTQLKKTTDEIIKILSSFEIVAHLKKGNKQELKVRKLFSVDGADLKGTEDTLLEKTFIIRATDEWYKHALEPPDGKSPQYTKLLKKIARENHRNNRLTIYLAGLLAIFWRIEGKEKKLKVKSLLDWCDLKTGAAYGRRDIKELETEFNYMKEKNYLGNWEHSGEKALPSQCKNPLEVVITFYPPEWLEREDRRILDARTVYSIEQKTPLTRSELADLVNRSGYSQGQFAKHIGVSRQYLNYLLNGKKPITPTISHTIRLTFPG